MHTKCGKEPVISRRIYDRECIGDITQHIEESIKDLPYDESGFLKGEIVVYVWFIEDTE